jgi:uncharacterized Zn finger protein (UPF0148 family)
MNREAVASELIRIAEMLVGTTGTFKCPECGTKVLENTGYCIKCEKKVKQAGVSDQYALAKLPHMALNEIASLIYEDWENVNYAAKPYLEAMSTLRDIKDNYIQDTGYSIVAYFLSNASSWKGEVAKVVKKELNRRLKTAR